MYLAVLPINDSFSHFVYNVKIHCWKNGTRIKLNNWNSDQIWRTIPFWRTSTCMQGLKLREANPHSSSISTLHSQRQRYHCFGWNRKWKNVGFCFTYHLKFIEKTYILLWVGASSNKIIMCSDCWSFQSFRKIDRTESSHYYWWIGFKRLNKIIIG